MMRTTLVTAAAAAAVLLAVPASAEPAELIDLFDRVCLDGGTNAAPGEVQPVRLRDLPAGARRALNLLSPEYEGRDFLRLMRATNGGGASIASQYVPNRIYRLTGGTEAYLLTPAAPSADGLGGQCILVWQGDDYLEAGRAMRRWLGADGEPPAQVEPVNFGWQNSPVLTAASLRDWTVLRAAPTAAR